MKTYKNMAEALEQLEKCKFEDEIGHPLENNTAFIYLKELSNSKIRYKFSSGATPETLKMFFMQIEKAKSPNNRWKPELICEMLDIIFNEIEVSYIQEDKKKCKSCIGKGTKVAEFKPFLSICIKCAGTGNE